MFYDTHTHIYSGVFNHHGGGTGGAHSKNDLVMLENYFRNYLYGCKVEISSGIKLKMTAYLNLAPTIEFISFLIHDLPRSEIQQQPRCTAQSYTLLTKQCNIAPANMPLFIGTWALAHLFINSRLGPSTYLFLTSTQPNTDMSCGIDELLHKVVMPVTSTWPILHAHPSLYHHWAPDLWHCSPSSLWSLEHSLAKLWWLHVWLAAMLLPGRCDLVGILHYITGSRVPLAIHSQWSLVTNTLATFFLIMSLHEWFGFPVFIWFWHGVIQHRNEPFSPLCSCQLFCPYPLIQFTQVRYVPFYAFGDCLNASDIVIVSDYNTTPGSEIQILITLCEKLSHQIPFLSP